MTKHAGRRLYLLTTTGPGTTDHRMWVPGWNKRSPRPECACHVGQTPALWNPTAGQCWNRLRTGLRRLAPDAEFMRVTETQARGVLHHHTIVATATALNVHQLQAVARASGYGCVIDLQPIDDPRKGVDHYLTKTLGGYLTKASDTRADVPWLADGVDQETGEVRKMHRAATYRTHSESRGWGLTVAAVRAAARDHVQRQATAQARAHRDQPQQQPAAPTAAGHQVTGEPPP